MTKLFEDEEEDELEETPLCEDGCGEDEEDEDEPADEGDVDLFGNSAAEISKREAMAKQRESWWEKRKQAIREATGDPDPDMLFTVQDAIRCACDSHNDEWKDRFTDYQLTHPRGDFLNEEEDTKAYIGVLGYLLREGAIDFHSADGFQVLDWLKLPAEDRGDLYTVALEYIAHELIRDHIGHHDLMYKVRIYGHDVRQGIWDRLKAEGYIDANGKILKRPAGATVQHWERTVKGGGVTLWVYRHEGLIRVTMNVGVAMKIGLGVSGPVWNGGYGEEWATREEAIRAGWLYVVEQLEECYEHAMDEPNTKAARIASELRQWVEGQYGQPIPRQIAVNYLAEHKAALAASRYQEEEDDEEMEANAVERQIPAQSSLF
jgi:hypothetical protein